MSYLINPEHSSTKQDEELRLKRRTEASRDKTAEANTSKPYDELRKGYARKPASDSALKTAQKKQLKKTTKKDTSGGVSNHKSAGTNAAISAVAGGGDGQGVAGTAGDALMAGGMATGNVYAVGAGAALKVVGSVQAKKERDKQAKYQHEVNEANAINRRRENLTKLLANLGSGVGSVGMS